MCCVPLAGRTARDSKSSSSGREIRVLALEVSIFGRERERDDGGYGIWRCAHVANAALLARFLIFVGRGDAVSTLIKAWQQTNSFYANNYRFAIH